MMLDGILKRGSLQNGDATLKGGAIASLLGGKPTGSGIRVNRNNAVTLSAVYRAIRVRSEAVAASRLDALNRETLAVEEFPLFTKMHPLMTTYQWAQLVVAHLDTAGDHFSIIVRGKRIDGSPVQGLYPVDPELVTVEWLWKPGERVVPFGRQYTIIGNDGRPVIYNEENILHIPGLGFDGLRGMSVLKAAAESLGTNLAAELYAGKLYGSGSLMSGLLKTEKKLDDDQARSMKNRWQAKVAGMMNAGEVVVMDSGLTFESMTINPQDAQFIESRDFGVDEVARWFGVPVRNLMKSGNAASVKQQVEQDSIEFSLHTLEPLTANIEASLDTVIPTKLRSNFDLSRFERGDTKTRSGAQLLSRKGSIKSINDLRREDGLPPDPDPRADDIFLPLSGGAGPESGGEDMGGETADQGEGNDGEAGTPSDQT